MAQLQLDYLDGAKQRGLACVLSELKEIAKASGGSRKKYLHLMTTLSEMKLLGLPPKLEEMIRCGESRGSSRLIDEIDIRVPADSALEVIFVQPRNDTSDQRDGFQHICFGKFADIIEGSGQLGHLLACYLRRWKTDPGTCPGRHVG